MTNIQIKICNILLKYFLENHGQSQDRNYNDFFKQNGFTDINITNSVVFRLIDYGLLKRHPHIEGLKILTPEGENAAMATIE